jgi:hypothetical protein
MDRHPPIEPKTPYKSALFALINWTSRGTEAFMSNLKKREAFDMSNKMTARIAALPDMTATELKALWQSLYAKEPPPFNKTYFVKRLAYRIQELEYGVDSRPLERQLEAHARQQMDMQGKPKRKSKRQPVTRQSLAHG